MKSLRALIAAGAVVASFGVAVAKLPPPAPPTEEQKKAAEEKKAKDAATAEAAKAAQARAEDRVVARYLAEQKAKGKDVRAPAMDASGAAPGAVLRTPGTVPTTAGAGVPAVSSQPEKAEAHSPTPTKR